jgi:hypothetical protein
MRILLEILTMAPRNTVVSAMAILAFILAINNSFYREITTMSRGRCVFAAIAWFSLKTSFPIARWSAWRIPANQSRSSSSHWLSPLARASEVPRSKQMTRSLPGSRIRRIPPNLVCGGIG